MIRRPPRSTQSRSSAASDVYKRQDPTDGVRLPRGRRADVAMSIPTPEEVGQLIAVADERFQPFIALCAFAGLRLGEAAGVQLGDVDFLRKTLRDAGLSGIKLHDLRHFYASGLIAAGCDVVTVQRALGHAKATTTLNTYAQTRESPV